MKNSLASAFEYNNEVPEDLNVVNDYEVFKEAFLGWKTLTKDDYIIDDETNTISLNDSGVEKTQKYFKIKK